MLADAEADRTVVLDDALSIRFRNNKPQFIAVFFERRKVIRFHDREDIRRHARVLLPESLDPAYDQHLIPWNERDEGITPAWFNVRLDHFAARILRPGGTWEELPVNTVVRHREIRGPRTIDDAWSYACDVIGVMPGDVVEIHWQYMVPYDSSWPASRGWRTFRWMDNWARLTNWRVFFHGALPVLHQQVEIVHHPKHGVLLSGELPHVYDRSPQEMRATWNFKDLAGCISETNARPTEVLPHIIVEFKPDDGQYWRRDRLSGLPFEQPYWLQVVRVREANADWLRRVSLKWVPDRQNELVREFMRQTGGGDTSLVRRMERIHETIALEHEYLSDRAFYLEQDNSLARMGDQVRNRELRDISRYDLYCKLLNNYKLYHHTAYVLDSRIGRMTGHFMSPIWDSEFLFAVPDGEERIWMHPKRSRYGLLANELPFYWQGSSGLFIDLAILLQDIPSPPRFIDMPVDDPAGNMRGVEYVLEIDADQGSVEGTARVFLSGQFSTMGRAAFMGGAIDSTVDPLYGWRPSDLSGVRSSAWSQGDLSTGPPFRFRSGSDIQWENAVEASVDDGLFLDLAPLVAHVVPVSFSAGERVLPFHWDFAQTDHFGFELSSQVPMEWIGASSLRTEGPGCRVETTVAQEDPYHLRVERRFVVDETMVGPEGFLGLEGVIEAAHASMLVRLVPSEPPR